MAINRVLSVLVLATTVAVLFSPPLSSNAHTLVGCGFDQIYNLGDSISDTGNLIRETPVGALTPFSRLPYGMNFFHNATGRCSDGLLMIDFIAKSAGLPLLRPYKDSKADFRHGANFAVAGSTALSSPDLLEKGISNPVTNSSLRVQLDWMSNLFHSTCRSQKDCEEKLRTALFMVGEIGGNDYNYAFFQGKTVEEVQLMVPEVVETIKDAVRRVINFGARTIVVPGNFPIGCIPIYLSAFQTNNSAAYDERNCLKDLNNFAMYHNVQLQNAIEDLRKENPDAKIIYGDYYDAYQYLLLVASRSGFELQKACCGTGGNYNFNMTRMCGTPEVPVCFNPAGYVSWDGVHSTEEAYKIMAEWLTVDFFWEMHCFP